MPEGIERSLYTRPFADALGLSLQSLRNILNKNGYHAPYNDVHRMLRILKEEGRDIRGCLKAANMRLEDIQPDPGGSASPPSTALVLTQSPAPPTPLGHDHALAFPASHFSNSPLIVRLALATPGGNTLKTKQAIREVFDAAGFDLRSRDEETAQLLLRQAGFVLTNFESKPGRSDEAEREQTLDNLNPPQLLQAAHELNRQIQERDAIIAMLRLRLSKARAVMDLGNKELIEAIREQGKDEITDAEILFLHARRGIKKGQSEDA